MYTIYCLLFLIVHFCICTLFFGLIQRPLFIVYNHSVSNLSLGFSDFIQTFWHGLYTDVKVASYLTGIPLLLTWIYAHFPFFDLVTTISVYDVIVAIPLATLCVADTALYKFWQFKIEASVLVYLQSLKGTFASVSTFYVLKGLFVILMEVFLFTCPLLLATALIPQLPLPVLPWWGHLIVFICSLLLCALFFVIIRGLHIRPDTPVYSYYSNNQFLNHSAVNPVYNFIYSLSLREDLAHQFQEFDTDFCEQQFRNLFPTQGIPQLQLINTNRPNILVIVWESLCAQFMSCLGGRDGVMPQFDQLAEEGVLFTNCWSGSFRTDRGLVCILSGYLGMPTTSAILYTNKLPHLPALPRLLRDKYGYETMAVHGGELNIFHKSDYYWASGHDKLVEQSDFPKNAPAAKWGVHDGYVFNWLADEIIKKEGNKRWFSTFQTLSTHEPFKVPYNRIKTSAVDNSYAYADEAFGTFINRLKKSSAWKDLLIVVTGDHGLDVNCAPDKDKNTHIPLLLLGGAVKQPVKIDTLINQTDIAATILGQMGIPHDNFIFSRDITADTYQYPFAFHTYNNGFIFRDSSGVTEYDNVSQRAISGHDEKRENTAKVILQKLYSDFSKR